MVWNSEGKLVSSSEPATGSKPKLATNYLYDASGELLIRRATGDGETVLYLGGTEVHLTTKGTTKTLSGTRYYTAAGQTIALRTATSGVSGTKLKFLCSDTHGTASIALEPATWAVTKRYTTPFGSTRGGPATTWPDDKGFLGKPADTTTGLTHIGAREYDPGIGQFISVDPILSVNQHQSLNGYSYASNTPVTASDSTGLMRDGGGDCGQIGTCNPDPNAGSDNCYGGNHSASCNPTGQGGAVPGAAPGGSRGTAGGGGYSGGNQGVSTEIVPPLGNGDLWIDQWTNGNGHLWVNSNYQIAEEYRLKAAMCMSDPILLACTSSTASTISKGVTVGQALMYWATGTAPQAMVYGDGSDIAGLMARTPEAGRARHAAMEKWKRHGNRDLARLSTYSIGKFSTAQKAAQVTRDAGSMLGNLQDPNSVKVLLGSFKITGRVLASSKRGIQVKFMIDEISDIPSAAHLITGYEGLAAMMVEGYLGDGVGSFMTPVSQKVTWRETLLY